MKYSPVLISLFLVPMLMPLAAAQEDDIATKQDIIEAVFRCQFADTGGLDMADYVYFLKIGSRDPDSAFLQRFAANNPPVKPASKSGSEKNSVIDPETKKQGIIFYVESLRIINEDEAVVRGGYVMHGTSATGCTYNVKRVDGKWKVVKVTLDWIA